MVYNDFKRKSIIATWHKECVLSFEDKRTHNPISEMLNLLLVGMFINKKKVKWKVRRYLWIIIHIQMFNSRLFS